MNDHDSAWAGLTGESSKYRALNVIGQSRNSGRKISRTSVNSIDNSEIINSITPQQINLHAARVGAKNRFNDFKTTRPPGKDPKI